MSQMLFSMGFGVGTQNRKGEWLEVFYAKPLLNPNPELITKIASIVNYTEGNQVITLTSLQAAKLAHTVKSLDEMQAALLVRLAESMKPIVVVLLAEDTAPTSTAEIYLKLHLLSHRLVKPHQINLTGIFSVLPNVAWTNLGAIDLEELAEQQLEERLKDRLLNVISVDKFPPMANYVVPSKVRIADAARVRLGAYLGEGTTIMHEGFCNFNAGTEGPSMVEGRISGGVIIGQGSDLGGGSSVTGVLSGGAKTIISVGRNTLIGANAGISITLGDDCIVESGLYITPNTKVTVIDANNSVIKTVNAQELAGVNDLLFVRNSETGRVEAKSLSKEIKLNDVLHQNA